MTVVVYGFADGREPGVHGPGLGGRPLRTVVHQDVAAVLSDHDAPRLEYSGRSLWEYERVMERLVAGRTVVPARFGTVLTDDGEALGLVRERHDDLARGLERVRDAVELGARARWRDSERAGVSREPIDGSARAAASPRPAGPGIAYMSGLVARDRQARELARRLGPLAQHARDVRLQLSAGEDFPAHAAYLVDRARVDAFTAAIRDLDQREPEIELVCTGPWPPYSFARALDLAGTGYEVTR